MFDKYIVYVDNVPIMRINHLLCEKNNINDNLLECIKLLHIVKHLLKHELEVSYEILSDKRLKQIERSIEHIRYALQNIWGFNESYNYHRFWDVPYCTCPKMDNEDRYGTSHTIISNDCPYHGSFDKDKTDRIYDDKIKVQL